MQGRPGLPGGPGTPGAQGEVVCKTTYIAVYNIKYTYDLLCVIRIKLVKNTSVIFLVVFRALQAQRVVLVTLAHLEIRDRREKMDRGALR